MCSAHQPRRVNFYDEHSVRSSPIADRASVCVLLALPTMLIPTMLILGSAVPKDLVTMRMEHIPRPEVGELDRATWNRWRSTDEHHAPDPSAAAFGGERTSLARMRPLEDLIRTSEAWLRPVEVNSR